MPRDLVSRLLAENNQLRQKKKELFKRINELEEEIKSLKARRSSLTGWWVAEDLPDGSLILESHLGHRKHVWSAVEPADG